MADPTFTRDVTHRVVVLGPARRHLRRAGRETEGVDPWERGVSSEESEILTWGPGFDRGEGDVGAEGENFYTCTSFTYPKS